MADLANSLPPLEWIRVFEAAGRTGSFTAAAMETGLTQAAVSQRIRNLEGRLGTQLFDRKPRGVILTVDGEAWLPYVANALDMLQRSTQELFEQPLNKITILASASIIQLWVAPRLNALVTDTNYQISLHTINIESDYISADSEIDVRYGSGSWKNTRCEKLYDEKLSPLASPAILQNKQLDWQELPRIAIAGPRLGWQQWASQIAGAKSPVPTLRFDSFAQALAAATSGTGVLLGSLPLCAGSLEAGTLVRLSPLMIESDASYWMTSKYSALPLKQWDHLVECFCNT